MIKPCTCKSEFQDKQYGNGRRLHRVNAKGEAKCTVCHPVRWKNRMKSYSESQLFSAACVMPPKSKGPFYS